MGVASILGSFVYKTSYDDLPENVIAGTKDRIIDFLATAFDSYYRAPMEPVIRVLKSFGGKEEATVIGEGSKLPCVFATIANCAYTMSISDGYRLTGGHPGCIVVPAALTVSDARCRTKSVSGRELITALVAAYEVMFRIGLAMYPSAHKRGFSPTTIQGAIGAAAAASKILGLSEKSTINALSIASLMSHGLQAAGRAPHPLFSFVVGRAAEAGVLSALTAQAGLKGSDDILEEGFFPAFSDDYHLDLIGKDLGKSYSLPKTYLKLHGGFRPSHACIDAIQYMVKNYGLNPDDIEKIRVRQHSHAFVLIIENPKNGRQAEYNIPFILSLALLYGTVSLDRFTDATLKDERIQQLMKRITVERDPELDKEYPQKRPSVVEVTTRSGQVFSRRVDLPKGEPEDPLSRSELENKFHSMASSVVDEKTRQKILDFVDSLETIENVAGLFPLLKATSRAK